MLYIPNNAGIGSMSEIWKEVIVSITPGMAGVSSVIAGPTSDYFGRKRIIVVASLVFSSVCITPKFSSNSNSNSKSGVIEELEL